MIGAGASVPLSLLLGFLLVKLAWPRRQSRHAVGVQMFLSAGLGLGWTSCLVFLWLSASGDMPKRMALLGFEGLLAALLGWFYRFKNGGDTDKAALSDGSRPHLLLRIVLVTAGILAALSFLSVAYEDPHGSSGVWSQWNLHARMMFRGGTHWKDAYSPLLHWLTYPDRPMMIPASILRCWIYGGRETVGIPILISFVFAFSTVGLLFSALDALHCRSQAYLGALLLLSTPFFIENAGRQFLDGHCGYFLLSSLVLLFLNERSPNAGLSILAGCMAGFMAWIKNDGLLVVGALLLSQFLVEFPKDRKRSLKNLACFACGALPVLVVVACFKVRLAGASEIFSQTPASLLDKLFDVGRYAQVLYSWRHKLLDFGDWTINPEPWMALYILAVGVRTEAVRSRTVPIVVLTILLSLLGYFIVLVLTPGPLIWYVGLLSLNGTRTVASNTVDRLFLQFWPSVLFLFLVSCRRARSLEPCRVAIVKEK